MLRNSPGGRAILSSVDYEGIRPNWARAERERASKRSGRMRGCACYRERTAASAGMMPVMYRGDAGSIDDQMLRPQAIRGISQLDLISIVRLSSLHLVYRRRRLPPVLVGFDLGGIVVQIYFVEMAFKAADILEGYGANDLIYLWDDFYLAGSPDSSGIHVTTSSTNSIRLLDSDLLTSRAIFPQLARSRVTSISGINFPESPQSPRLWILHRQVHVVYLFSSATGWAGYISGAFNFCLRRTIHLLGISVEGQLFHWNAVRSLKCFKVYWGYYGRLQSCCNGWV